MSTPIPGASHQPPRERDRQVRRLARPVRLGPKVLEFEISWQVNATSRRRMEVDHAAAVTFCMKWGLEMPQ